MSQSNANEQATSESNPSDQSADALPKFADKIQRSPSLTSYTAGWRTATLEYYRQPAGETPKLCLDHYAIAICLNQGVEIEQQIAEIAKGRLQTDRYFQGGSTLIPMHHTYWGRWRQPVESIMVNLSADLLHRNAAEILHRDRVELLPRTLLHDPLILQIALALKADLESGRPGGRLYAETLTTALAVHLLRNYASQQQQSRQYTGGLSPTQIQPVLDYITTYLDQQLSLEELAEVAQLSPYHFCRSFKRSLGFTPHQYVIRQRVERAKLLLRDGKMGISEVAIACGFTHQSHLNRHFKRLTGITPKKFSTP